MMSTLPLLFNVAIEVLCQIKLLKGIQIGKDEIRLSLFTNSTILYLENIKEYLVKLLKLVGKFNKVKRHKKYQ